MNVEIWTLGRESAAYIDEGVSNYINKVKPWVPVELIVLQVPKKFATNDAEKAKLAEQDLIMKRLTTTHTLILLDERGKMLSSPQWSQQFQGMMNRGVKTVALLIGGAYGVTEAVRLRADQCWSLSPLVFPHQLVRLLVSEQVYRAFSIINHSPYHHI